MGDSVALATCSYRLTARLLCHTGILEKPSGERYEGTFAYNKRHGRYSAVEGCEQALTNVPATDWCGCCAQGTECCYCRAATSTPEIL